MLGRMLRRMLWPMFEPGKGHTLWLPQEAYILVLRQATYLDFIFKKKKKKKIKKKIKIKYKKFRRTFFSSLFTSLSQIISLSTALALYAPWFLSVTLAGGAPSIKHRP